MAAKVSFDQIIIGKKLGPVESTVTQKAIKNYILDWEDDHPLYQEYMPPAFMAGLICFRLLSRAFDTSATVCTKSQQKTIGKVKIGSRLISTGYIADKYIKRGYQYVVVKSTTHDENNNPIRFAEDHIMLGLERVGESTTA